MPSHQERREPLPNGYQFGDAGVTVLPCGCRLRDVRHGKRIKFCEQHREKLDWNVIEGEQH